MSGTEAAKVELSAQPAVAFGRLADEHLDDAYRLACAILRDPTEAQDATHDAFLQAWRKWGTLRDRDRFEAWFDRILVNTCRDRLRRKSRWRMGDISDEVVLASGDDFARAHDRDAIDAALGRLSTDHQVVVALRYYRDLSTDEIAARLDIPKGTVLSRIHYALRRLHDIIEDLEPGDTTR